MRQKIYPLITIALALVSCGLLQERVEQSTSAIAPRASPTAVPSTPVPTSIVPEAEEVIMILEPGPGSTLTSPLRILGMADSVFEQNLSTRLVLDDGTTIAEGFVTIQSPLGQRGAFEGELEFSIDQKRNASIQVFSQSARDGGTTHLSSVGVTIAPDGPAQILAQAPMPESIQIFEPVAGSAFSSGSAIVSGFGIASFEGTLIVEVIDVDGTLLAQQPLIVNAPDMGLPGVFQIELEFAVDQEGPGRVVVTDPLPVFNGIGHVVSVEVLLIP
jgi:hypothetical protein